jgi:hypothetical protein
VCPAVRLHFFYNSFTNRSAYRLAAGPPLSSSPLLTSQSTRGDHKSGHDMDVASSLLQDDPMPVDSVVI